jgi:hypothetical protein
MSTHPNHVTAPQADPALVALMVENAKLREELSRAIAQNQQDRDNVIATANGPTCSHRPPGS